MPKLLKPVFIVSSIIFFKSYISIFLLINKGWSSFGERITKSQVINEDDSIIEIVRKGRMKFIRGDFWELWVMFNLNN